MDQTQSRAYLDWLRTKVDAGDSKYDKFFTVAFDMDFYEIVPNDNNRALDGLALRKEYERDTGEELQWSSDSCSVLEMMIGVSIRVNYILQDQDHPDQLSYWFQTLMDNLGFINLKNTSSSTIEDRLGRMVRREYTPDGNGGLFPLFNYNNAPDQRQAEIWYQMHSWILELSFLQENT